MCIGIECHSFFTNTRVRSFRIETYACTIMNSKSTFIHIFIRYTYHLAIILT